MELISIEWHNYDYATVSRQIVHSTSRAPNANDRSHKLYLALLLVWLMTWLRSQSSRQSHQHNTDNLANSTTWQQTALQSANSTTSTNTLSEITVDRYSNIQGNIWLNIDRYVILALYARSRITWRRRVLSYPYTMRWIAGCPFQWLS